MELKKIELPSGTNAYLKPELTAGEYDEVQAVFLADINISFTPNEGVANKEIKFNPSVMIKAKYKLLSIGLSKLELLDGNIVEKFDEAYVKGMSMKDVEVLAREADKLYATSSLDNDTKKK